MNLVNSPDHLRAVVAAFADFDFDVPGCPTLEEFRSPAIVFSRQYWEGIKHEFTVRERMILARALTVLEREFRWTGGSGAAAIWILKDLQEGHPGSAAALAQWIVPRTENGYLRLACDQRPEVRVWVGDLNHQAYGA